MANSIKVMFNENINKLKKDNLRIENSIKKDMNTILKNSQLSIELKKLNPNIEVESSFDSYRNFNIPRLILIIDDKKLELCPSENYLFNSKNNYCLNVNSYRDIELDYKNRVYGIDFDCSLDENINSLIEKYNFKILVDECIEIVNNIGIEFINDCFKEYNKNASAIEELENQLSLYNDNLKSNWIDSVIEGKTKVHIKAEIDFDFIKFGVCGEERSSYLHNGDKPLKIMFKKSPKRIHSRFKLNGDKIHKDESIYGIKSIKALPRNLYSAEVLIYSNGDYEIVTFTKENIECTLSTIYDYNHGEVKKVDDRYFHRYDEENYETHLWKKLFKYNDKLYILSDEQFNDKEYENIEYNKWYNVSESDDERYIVDGIYNILNSEAV